MLPPANGDNPIERLARRSNDLTRCGRPSDRRASSRPRTAQGDSKDDDLSLTLTRAEQAGCACFCAASWLPRWRRGVRTCSRSYPVTLYVGLMAGAPRSAGPVQCLIGKPWDRWWTRYAFITIDVDDDPRRGGLRSAGAGRDLPPIFAFRIDAFNLVYLMRAVAALSFSPGLVIWAGLVAAACLVGERRAGSLEAMSNRPRILDWGDVPQPPTLDGYMSIVLNVNFIGTGSRVQEAVVAVTVSLILAIAVHRARGIVRARARPSTTATR